MSLAFDDGVAVTLPQMLHAKEQRVNRQQQSLAQYHLPIISLTLVMPGRIKNSSGANYLFTHAMAAIKQHFAQQNIEQIAIEEVSDVTGPEAIMVFNCDVKVLKNACITLEESHPLGRLWDIDVIDPITQISLSRHDFTKAPRQCLVCQHPAKVCGRSRQHSIEEIMAVIQRKVNDYKNC